MSFSFSCAYHSAVTEFLIVALFFTTASTSNLTIPPNFIWNLLLIRFPSVVLVAVWNYQDDLTDNTRILFCQLSHTTSYQFNTSPVFALCEKQGILSYVVYSSKKGLRRS